MARDFTHVPIGSLCWDTLKKGDRVRLPDGRTATVIKEMYVDESKRLSQQLEITPDAD